MELTGIGRVMGRNGRLVLADVFDTPPPSRRFSLLLRHRGVGPHVPEQLQSAVLSAGLTCARAEPVPLTGPIPPATIVSAHRRHADELL
jgi:hypothetical protein